MTVDSLNLKLMNQIARWWHGKGFGIQSRTDYEYLKDVIKEPLPYYAYEQIKSERARLIYRVCNHDKERKVTMVGMFTPEEQTAARLALHHEPDTTPQLAHLHGRETVIVSDITGDNAPLWQMAQEAQAITWDMGSIGLVRFVEGRYPEHYVV